MSIAGMISPLRQRHFDRTPHAIGEKFEPRDCVELVGQHQFDQSAAESTFSGNAVSHPGSTLK
jgi:hypothetical protein